jgi:signal transduction histidine kinase
VPGSVRLYVRGIEEDLRTAVLNILDNAIKYSPNGVHVVCSIAIAQYTLLALIIADTGLGLPPGQHKRIFKRFYRVPGRNAVRIRGTGLGLFLVRAIVRQHGGDISASSPGPNLGTTITLTLPLANPAASP